MQFVQPQPVSIAQQLLCYPRRARIVAQLAAAVHVTHQLHIFSQRCRQIGAWPQACNPGFVFGILGGVTLIEFVQPGTGMGIDVVERRVFLLQVFDQLHQHKVLEHVGMIAGMEGVAVAQHGVPLERSDSVSEACILARIFHHDGQHRKEFL